MKIIKIAGGGWQLFSKMLAGKELNNKLAYKKDHVTQDWSNDAENTAAHHRNELQ